MTELTTIPLEDVKGLLIDIISDLDRFCREKGLRYSLAYGSLIGAVRHKGFIPWDDDVDIIMPRPDYLRLLNEYHHPYYEIHCQEKDVEFPLTFAKVCDMRTLSIDKKGNKSHIAVDIFILDGLGSSHLSAKLMIKRVEKMRRLWSSQLFTRRLAIDEKYGFKKNCLILGARVLGLFLPFDRLVRKMLALFQCRDIDKSAYCSIFDGSFKVFETSKMLEFTDGVFENSIFKIPKDYDYQLRLEYGDYWKLPPEEKRILTHEATAYWV